MTTIAGSQRGPESLGGVAQTTANYPFTCNTCQVAFRSSETQKTHMRGDWHRYNLKRRVASLPPLSSELFAEKVHSAQANTTAAAAKASFTQTCNVCQKTYFSENAYQNHIGSSKHRSKVAHLASSRSNADETASVMSSTFSMGEPVKSADKEFSDVVDGLKDASLEDQERPARPTHSSAEQRPDHPLSRTSTETPTEGDVFPLERCLFCNYRSPTAKLSVMHMEKFHGMFIPEKTYLADEEGLIKYLAEKITEDHECLYCHKLHTTLPGVQGHMRDKGHCMIAFETEDDQVEIGQYYDFSSTYSDDEDEMDGVKLPSGEDDDDEKEEGDGWETDSSASSLDSDDLSAVPIDDHTHQYAKLSTHRHHGHEDPRPHKNADGYHSHAHNPTRAVFHDDYELHLPSGRTAGHRSLNKYYRQNLHNYPTAEERVERQLAIEAAQDDEMDVDGGERALQQTERGRDRARGGALVPRGTDNLALAGATDAQKSEVRAEHKRSIKVEQRARRQQEWNVNKKANSQKHFRDPLLQ